MLRGLAGSVQKAQMFDCSVPLKGLMPITIEIVPATIPLGNNKFLPVIVI